MSERPSEGGDFRGFKVSSGGSVGSLMSTLMGSGDVTSILSTLLGGKVPSTSSVKPSGSGSSGGLDLMSILKSLMKK